MHDTDIYIFVYANMGLDIPLGSQATPMVMEGGLHHRNHDDEVEPIAQ
jgi:hypothetical protein